MILPILNRVLTSQIFAPAGKTITNIVRAIRKLSQTYDMTFILVQRKPRMNYNVKHVGRMVRSMLDNQVLLNGPKVLIDCVYDNL